LLVVPDHWQVAHSRPCDMVRPVTQSITVQRRTFFGRLQTPVPDSEEISKTGIWSRHSCWDQIPVRRRIFLTQEEIHALRARPCISRQRRYTRTENLAPVLSVEPDRLSARGPRRDSRAKTAQPPERALSSVSFPRLRGEIHRAAASGPTNQT